MFDINACNRAEKMHVYKIRILLPQRCFGCGGSRCSYNGGDANNELCGIFIKLIKKYIPLISHDKERIIMLWSAWCEVCGMCEICKCFIWFLYARLTHTALFHYTVTLCCKLSRSSVLVSSWGTNWTTRPPPTPVLVHIADRIGSNVCFSFFIDLLKTKTLRNQERNKSIN